MVIYLTIFMYSSKMKLIIVFHLRGERVEKKGVYSQNEAARGNTYGATVNQDASNCGLDIPRGKEKDA